MAVIVEECQGVIYFKDIENAKEILDVAKKSDLILKNGMFKRSIVKGKINSTSI